MSFLMSPGPEVVCCTSGHALEGVVRGASVHGRARDREGSKEVFDESHVCILIEKASFGSTAHPIRLNPDGNEPM